MGRAERGRIVLIGPLSGSETKVDLRALMSRRLQVTGGALRKRNLLEKGDLTAEFGARLLPGLRAESRPRTSIGRSPLRMPSPPIASSGTAGTAGKSF